MALYSLVCFPRDAGVLGGLIALEMEVQVQVEGTQSFTMGCEGHKSYLREHGLALDSEGPSLGVRDICPLALRLPVLHSLFVQVPGGCPWK